MIPPDMSDDTMLCLRWNNSASKLNLSTAFQDLRENSDFFDVSLGCSDGGGARSLRAHKAILSAYSSAFRDMLKSHVNKTDPYIYLNGVSFDDLSATLDFMYNGEVSVKQASLNSFLEFAKDVQVKGLAENIKAPKFSNPLKRESNQNKSSLFDDEYEEERRKKMAMKKAQSYKQGRHDNDIKPSLLDLQNYGRNDPLFTNEQPSDMEDMSMNELNDKRTIESASKKRKMSRCHICSKEGRSDYIKQHIRVAHPQSMLKEENDPTEQLDSLLSTYTNGNEEYEQKEAKTGSIDSLLEYMDKKVQQGSHSRKFAKCKVCSKEGRSDNMKLHVKNNHKEEMNSV